MIGCGTNTFNDPDDFRARVPGLKMELVLTGKEPFRAYVTWADLPRLRVLSIEERAPRIAFISLTPGMVFVSFPLRSDRPFYWNGVRLQRGEIVLHVAGERFHQRGADPMRWGMISLTPADFAAYSLAVPGMHPVLPESPAILRPPKAVTRDLLRLHRQACRLAEEQPKVSAHHEVARVLERDLVGALVDGLGAARTVNHDRTRRRHAEIMARFEDVLAGQGGRPLPTPALCRAVGVPERTLRMCCQTFLGRGPAGYARLRRLNRVHAVLMHDGPATASIAAIALEHGFSEPGRFAISYRALFGETPSTTLRRSQSASARLSVADIA
jgi:AraC-like DNA-binding protein